MRFFLLEANGVRLDFSVTDAAACEDGARCSVNLNGNVLAPVIIGIDPFNAVENAIAFIRAYLSNRGASVNWEDGAPYEPIP